MRRSREAGHEHLPLVPLRRGVGRLLLGLQPIDASRAQPLAHAVEMRIEPKPWVDPLTGDQQRWLRARIESGLPLSDWLGGARRATRVAVTC